MTEKPEKNQALGRRVPRQARALEKIELMFEAASRILESDGLDALTTNRVAERAGVSIGTLYQYFPDKAALLDALAQRELQVVADKVMASLTGPAPERTGDRLRAVVRAVLGAYGGRTRVHKLLEHVLMNRIDSPIPGLRTAVTELMASSGIVGADGRRHSLSSSEAFVLTHAFAGVVRALVASSGKLGAKERTAMEDALVRLVTSFLASSARSAA